MSLGLFHGFFDLPWWGLVLVALGIALSIFFAGWGPGWSIGLIPGLMGVALLIAWKIETQSRP